MNWRMASSAAAVRSSTWPEALQRTEIRLVSELCAAHTEIRLVSETFLHILELGL